MHLNTNSVEISRKPCLRDLHRLTTTLLLPSLVQLVPLKELRRRIREINATHPQYREETPLVFAYEKKRRRQLSGRLEVSVNQCQMA